MLNGALFKVCNADGLCLSMKVDHVSLKMKAIYLVLGQSWIEASPPAFQMNIELSCGL